MLSPEDYRRLRNTRPAVERTTEKWASVWVLDEFGNYLIGRHKRLTRRGRHLSREEEGRLAEIAELLTLLHEKLAYAMKTMTTPRKGGHLPYLLRDVEARLDAQAEMEAAKRLL